MAYTYVPPRDLGAKPALTGITNTLKYINEFNAKRQAEMSKRMDNIFAMANQLDHFSTISAENKRMQNELYSNLVDGLTEITKENSDRNGILNKDGRLQKQLLFREAATQMAKLKQKEMEYQTIATEFSKNPQKYRPDKFAEYSALYFETADNKDKNGNEIRGLVERPVAPEIWMGDIKYDYPNAVEYEEGGYKVNKQTGMPSEERDAYYMDNILKSEGKAEGIYQKYKSALKNGQLNANAYTAEKYGDEMSAALEWGRNELAPQYIAPDKYDRNLISDKTKEGDIPLEPSMISDNEMVWYTGIKAKPISDKIKYYDESGNIKEKIVNNGKIAQVGYGKLPGGGYGSYIGIVNNSDIDVTSMTDAQAMAWISGAKKSGEYLVVPYKPYSNLIKNQFKLKGIEQLDKMMNIAPEVKEEPKEEIRTENKWDKYKLK